MKKFLRWLRLGAGFAAMAAASLLFTTQASASINIGGGGGTLGASPFIIVTTTSTQPATTTRQFGTFSPQVTNLYDLGEPAFSWRNIYASGTLIGASVSSSVITATTGTFMNLTWVNATGTGSTYLNNTTVSSTLFFGPAATSSLFNDAFNATRFGLNNTNPFLIIGTQANSTIDYGLHSFGLQDPIIGLVPGDGSKNHVSFFGSLPQLGEFLFSSGSGDDLDGTKRAANGLDLSFGAGNSGGLSGNGGMITFAAGSAIGGVAGDGGQIRFEPGSGTSTGAYGNIWLNGGIRVQYASLGDVDRTLTKNDYFLAVNVLTATHKYTLPPANTVDTGTSFELQDQTGNASTTLKLNIVTNDGTTIDGIAGTTGRSITTPYGSLRVMKGGLGNWYTVTGDLGSQYASSVNIQGGNVSSTNATSTNLNVTNLTVTNCTGCSSVTSTTFFPGLIWTNATGTNTTSTNLFASFANFTSVTGTAARFNSLALGSALPITSGGTGVSTLPTGLLTGNGTSAITVTTSTAETNCTPTVTLVGGAGNTVPQYATNGCRYSVLGQTVQLDVDLHGASGNSGNGTGIINIALPLPTNLSSNTFGSFPCGGYANSALGNEVYCNFGAGSSTATLLSGELLSSGIGGTQQSGSDRSIKLHFSYNTN